MKTTSLLFCIFLTACATTLPIPIKYPAPIIPSKVILPIKDLIPTSAPDQVIGAYTKSVRLLIIDDLDLRERLKSYHK